MRDVSEAAGRFGMHGTHGGLARGGRDVGVGGRVGLGVYICESLRALGDRPIPCVLSSVGAEVLSSGSHRVGQGGMYT